MKGEVFHGILERHLIEVVHENTPQERGSTPPFKKMGHPNRFNGLKNIFADWPQAPFSLSLERSETNLLQEIAGIRPETAKARFTRRQIPKMYVFDYINADNHAETQIINSSEKNPPRYERASHCLQTIPCGRPCGAQHNKNTSR